MIAVEYQEALQEVLRGFADDRQLALFEARSGEALRLWRLFLVKLRIAERVRGYVEEKEDSGVSDVGLKLDEDDIGGGFIPDPDQPIPSPLRASLDNDLATKVTSCGIGAFDGLRTETGHGNDHLADDFAPEELGAGPGDIPVSETDNKGNGFIPGDLGDSQGIPLTADVSSSSRETNFPGPRNNPKYELGVVPNKFGSINNQKTSNTHGALSHEVEGSYDQAKITVDSLTKDDSMSPSAKFLSRAPSPPTPESKPPPPIDSDSEIERGSLLSEDPEDENAVPDWLIFD